MNTLQTDRITDPHGWKWRPTRRGETHRACERCGALYEPRARTQKYCDACRAKRV